MTIGDYRENEEDAIRFGKVIRRAADLIDDGFDRKSVENFIDSMLPGFNVNTLSIVYSKAKYLTKPGVMVSFVNETLGETSREVIHS